jgi:hypothetical protein
MLLGSLHLAGCGSTTLLSPYRDQPLSIDANTQDWMGMPMYADKNGVNLSAAHDQEYLYVLVTTSTQVTQSQIMRGGLTMWFDPAGGSEDVIGIRYPHGIRGGPPPPERPEQSDNAELSPGPDFRAMDMEILGPGEDERMIVSLLGEKQIQAKIGNTDGTLTYELRIPLFRDSAHPYGIGYNGGGAIGIQLETPKGNSGLKGRPGGNKEGMRPPGGGMPQGDGSMPEGGSPRGRGGRGPGGGRQGGGPPGGGHGGQTQADPIDIHITVQLTRN